tara:strand:- start:245 stop:508 length:264 start_codon:yes stop_codon:yes gene_type:complete
MDSELIGGLYPKKRDGQPDFVIGKLSINVAQFREWMAEYLKANPGGEWINIDMLVSKAGKGYAKLDTWEPESKEEPKSEPVSEDIPF